ncbi:DUF4136 domain-containing protein [Rufibacter roseus]|uniref:DUF4136 domain-containing protein n=1 Tax=Rufibacter roseus TaxID=1567108 RepID=A0ABW2DGG2_9BACT|nr:hypothetical protein [Rufibacter roseus]
MIRRSLKVNVCLFILSIATIVGCAPTTQVTGTWVSPETAGKTYGQVIVAALTENAVAQQTIESSLQKQLQQRGITATKSIDMFSPDVMRNAGTNPDALLERIKSNRHDAILTVAVVDTEVEQHYLPSPSPYSPMARFRWYDSFRGYYGHMSPTVYNPGYYREDKTYFLESNLYDADSEKLLWSAQSQSTNPLGLERLAETFAEETVRQMRRDKLIR